MALQAEHNFSIRDFMAPWSVNSNNNKKKPQNDTSRCFSPFFEPGKERGKEKKRKEKDKEHLKGPGI